MRITLTIFFALFFQSVLYSQDLKITSKHSEFSISEQGKVQNYILLKSDSDLVIKAKGPIFINIKFRGLVSGDKKGDVSFTLSYLRDGGFRSSNEYTLKLEPKKKNRKIEVITEGGYWATEYRWIQIKVPDGEHIYQISRPVDLPEGLILKVYKAEKEMPEILAKPEVPEVPIAQLAPKKEEVRVISAQKSEEKAFVREEKVAKIEERKGPVVKRPYDKERYFSSALKVNILVPTSRLDSTYAFSLDLKYISPLLQNRLAFGVEVGYYPLSGSGKNLDPEIGLFDYSFSITNIPLFIGSEYLLPLSLPVGIYVDGGFAMVFSYATSKVFGGESYTDGIAYGYYLGAGAQISPGYGYIISELRYSSVYIKYDTKTDEGATGNMGGTGLFIGYKLVF